MVLNLDKNINNNLIGDIVESLVEILNTALVMLFEDFELRVLFVQFKRDDSSNYISKHVLEGKFITIIIVDRSNGTWVVFLFLLEVCFLSHNTDSLVCSLNCNLFHVTR